LELPIKHGNVTAMGFVIEAVRRLTASYSDLQSALWLCALAVQQHEHNSAFQRAIWIADL